MYVALHWLYPDAYIGLVLDLPTMGYQAARI
jgi:hypothetical protein